MILSRESPGLSEKKPEVFAALPVKSSGKPCIEQPFQN